MNPNEAGKKTRVKSTTATLTLVPVELGNLAKNATYIEVCDSNNKPLGRFFVGRIGIEFRGPYQKNRGVQKSWDQLIEWLSAKE